MNQKTLQEIDYFRIRDEIAGYCVSSEGCEKIMQREPLRKTQEIENLKNLSREWSGYFSAGRTNPLSSWEPVGPLLAIIRARGASLTLEQVHYLGQFITSINSVRKAIQLHAQELSLKLLAEEIAKLPDISDMEKRFSVLLHRMESFASCRKSLQSENRSQALMQKSEPLCRALLRTRN